MNRILRSVLSLGIASWTFGLTFAAKSARGGGATTIPAGSQIEVRLLDRLDTGQARAGQTFSATVANPVAVGGRTVLARDTKLVGRVVEAVSSGRLNRPASLTLELTEAGGATIVTEPLHIDGKSHLLRNVALIGGESAAGAIIGAAVGGEKGAGLGAAIGAGAGTGTAYMTGKKEIVLPVETRLTFVMAGGDAASAPAAAYRTHSDPRSDSEPPDFSEADRRIILRYYETNGEGLPPGLAKRGGHLPPGLERHLERDGTLPPGLQKRLEPLPVELDRQLRPLPGGYVRVVLDGRVLILDAQNRILDQMYVSRGRYQDEQGEDRDDD